MLLGMENLVMDTDFEFFIDSSKNLVGMTISKSYSFPSGDKNSVSFFNGNEISGSFS